MVVELFSQKTDYCLAMVYYWQAKTVAKTALRLPEPDGVRQLSFGYGTKRITLGIFGDSAAAGVGVDTQDEAPLGQIGTLLAKQLGDVVVDVRLHATSGHTSFDLLHRLYAMSICSFDVVIVSIGVNDVIKQTSNNAWANHIQAIITLFKRKFQVSDVIFLSLPPMHLAPSLPKPLNGLIGRRALALSAILAQLCHHHDHVHYVQDDFAHANLNHQTMFAKDGFHPSATTYTVWAKTLSCYISKLKINH